MIQNFSIGHVTMGGDLTLIAGPCMAENLDLCLQVAEKTLELTKVLEMQYVFKTSFDKANRSSTRSHRGPGIDEGLKILQKVKEEFNIPVTTDIHSPEQADTVKGIVDLIQIPAFLCRQTDLLYAAAKTGLPVSVKKGQFLAPWDTKNIVQKLEEFGANGILLMERGTSFGYNRLIVDMPGLEIMRSFGHPVCFDATHSVQLPTGQGETTGGIREHIPLLCRAAVAVGIQSLYLEVHPNPSQALSDQGSQWPLDQLEGLLMQIQLFEQARINLPEIDSKL